MTEVEQRHEADGQPDKPPGIVGQTRASLAAVFANRNKLVQTWVAQAAQIGGVHLRVAIELPKIRIHER